MRTAPRPAGPAACPFLAPVIADRLWLRPVGAYCRRPDGRVRVPGEGTLARVCGTLGHLGCSGYQASAGTGPPGRTEERAAAGRPAGAGGAAAGIPGADGRARREEVTP
jgi:hypothetical protein